MRRSIKSTGFCGLLCLMASGLPLFARADNYVLLIGIGKYEQKAIPSLDFDVNDVHGLEQAFLKNAGYPRDHVIVMTTEAKPDDLSYPSLKHVYKKLRDLHTMKADDTLFVYFSGHGVATAKEQYLLVADADLQLLDKTAFSLSDLHKELKDIAARQKVIILDACRNDANYTGLPAESKALNSELSKGLTAEAIRIGNDATPTGIYKFIFACSAGQKAQVFADGTPNSVFSYYMIKALRGGALKVGGSKRMTLSDVYDYVEPKVRAYAKEHNIEQQTLDIGGQAKAIVISENAHAVLPATLDVKALEPDVKVELAPQKYNPANGEVELNDEKESGTLILRRLGYKAQTRTLTFKSETTESAKAAPWENDPNSRIRFILPTKKPDYTQWGKLTFDTEVMSLEKDKSFRGPTMDVRAPVMDFVMDKDAVHFSIALINKQTNVPVSSGPVSLQGGRSYEIKLESNARQEITAVKVVPELSASLKTPPDPRIKVYVVPEGADYQIVHTDKGLQVQVNGEIQQSYRGGGPAPLDMGLAEEKKFWVLYSVSDKDVRRRSIHVTKNAKEFTQQEFPVVDDDTAATLDLTALPPGASATISVHGKNYPVEAADRNPLKIEMESYSATAIVTVHTPQYNLKEISVKLTAGQTRDLKAELASAQRLEQTLEIVSSEPGKITIVGMNGKAPQGLLSPNSFSATPGTQLNLTVSSPGRYLKEVPVTVAADQKQVVVQMEHHNLPTESGMVKKNPLDGADMIYIPTGSYTVGSSSSADKVHDFAQKQVSGGFWIYAYPVTVKQYSAFVEATHRKSDKLKAGNAGSQSPMTGISYADARDYAKWAGGSLPEETEWELAMRGNSVGDYPWGANWSLEKDWRFGKDADVGSNAKNHSSFGVSDVWGHVREWTTQSDDTMMIRGSSYAKQEPKKHGRLSWRSVEDVKTSKNYDDVGFRVVMPGTKAN